MILTVAVPAFLFFLAAVGNAG